MKKIHDSVEKKRLKSKFDQNTRVDVLELGRLSANRHVNTSSKSVAMLTAGLRIVRRLLTGSNVEVNSVRLPSEM